MNISKISLSTCYQKALAAVEGLQKDQRSTDTITKMSVETETEKEHRNF